MSGRQLVWLATVVGGAVVAALFWPGLMSSDSLDQLTQARASHYNLWHPPVMAWVWHWTDLLVPGPSGMLVLQLALLWGGLAIVCREVLRFARWGWAVLAIGWWPPVLALSGLVWKDVQMTASLVFAVALLVRGAHGSRWWVAAAIVPLWYATGLRHNALTGTVPLLLLCGWWLAKPLSASARGAAAVGLTVVTIFSSNVFNRSLSPTPMPPTQANMVHDLTGLSVATGEQLLPADYLLAAGGDAAAMRAAWVAETSDTLYFGPVKLRMISDLSVISSLRAHWRTAVLAHPADWLELRWKPLKRLLGLTPDSTYLHQVMEPNSLGIALAESPVRTSVFSGLTSLTSTPVFRHWLYVGLMLVQLVVAWRARSLSLLPIAMVASMAGYLAPLLVVLPAADFRYLYWNLLASLLLWPVISATRQSPTRPEGRTQGGALLQSAVGVQET